MVNFRQWIHQKFLNPNYITPLKTKVKISIFIGLTMGWLLGK